MAQQVESQKRHIAYKVNIKDILSGEYVRGEGWDPSYIILGAIKVSRIDVIASVIDKSPGSESLSFVIDDGDSQVLCRSFESISSISAISVGDIVHIIGRPRDYNGERYVLPEVIRKVEDPKWMLARKKELVVFGLKLYAPSDESKESRTSFAHLPKDKVLSRESGDMVAEEAIVDTEEVIVASSSESISVASQGPSKKSSNPQIIVELIRKMDEGKGVDQDVVISTSQLADCEKVIDHLLKEGEIFEIMPGKLKVLE